MFPYDPRRIAAALPRDAHRLVLFGEAGIGKSTLAAGLARAWAETGVECTCIGADPGLPAFGAPGAVSVATWQNGHWVTDGIDAICSLDAARFRLPLISAVRRLAQGIDPTALLVDTPGVVRGVAGAELLLGLIDACSADAVLVLVRDSGAAPLAAELRAAGRPVFLVAASPSARRPGKRERARARTRLWDAYLAGATAHELMLDTVSVIGTPPPAGAEAAWTGRQIALLDGHGAGRLGEVLQCDGARIRVRIGVGPPRGDVLLVRDAVRGSDGLLNTARPFAPPTLQYIPPPDVMPYAGRAAAGGPRLVARVGAATVTLVNGVLGDPLLHLRLRHRKRSLLFDLGEAGRLPGRIAHQVTDVFISHAHLDHIGGFLWLLRSRMGEFPACRLYGPPGLGGHVQGLINGIRWDRIGDRGPRFDVVEFDGERLRRCRVQAGRGVVETGATERAGPGVLLQEPEFRVRAVVLDHGTPVLAFAYEPAQEFNVRKERLAALGEKPGPWLSELKRNLAAGEREAMITLPGGRREQVGALADDLIKITAAAKLAYATDLADTAANRVALVTLANGAHTFFCEAAFASTDAEQAHRTGHLTTRACGEIARQAGVARLVPFHFSRRYEGDLARIYAEVQAVCPQVIIPKEIDITD